MFATVVKRDHVLEQEQALGQDPVSVRPSDQRDLEAIDAMLRAAAESARTQSRPKLVADGQEIELPGAIFGLLCQVVSHLKLGHAVSLVPVHQQLSTKQAADLLGVSRPFLIGLLERGEIPFVKTGKHRRIRLGDLMLFKRQRDANRRRALDRLTEMSQELGLDAPKD